ncbi:UDP-glucuronosyltransferase [Aphelenchoides besseyi]|nr:UDP-glucuronosyltransferase [Aphelenchoides besseyi]
MQFTSVILFFLSLSAVNSLKILIVNPVFGRSHLMFLGKLADTYVKGGHEVVIFEPDLAGDDPILNVTSSHLARIIRRPKDFELDHPFSKVQEQTWTLDTGDSIKAFEAMLACSKAFALSCESILTDGKLLADLRAEKFDIAVAEFLTVCPYALYKQIGIKKYITASATPLGSSMLSYMGVASAYSFVPEFFRVPPIKMSFMQRLENLIGAKLAELFFFNYFIGDVIKVVRIRIPEFDFANALSESSYVFVNAEEHLNYPQPITHKIINVGGLGLNKPKPLSDEYEKILTSSKRGVVLVSFGSIAQSANMPPAIKQAFLDTFSAFPDLTFIWKYENSSDNIAANHSNLHTRSWTPQLDLLADKRVIGFLTHGGINSIAEACIHGTNLICVPLFGDQLRNCKMLEERKLGVSLGKTELSDSNVIINAIKTITENAEYSARAKETSEMMQNKPMSPAEAVLRYTEFAARFDVASSLDIYGRRLNVIAFYNLDIFAFLILLVFLLLYVSFVVLRYAFRFSFRLFGKFPNKSTKSKSE